jgi:Ca2+-binding RTX toxin-like protein
LSFAGPVTLSGFDNLANVSEFQVISISGSSGTSSVTLNDTVFDSSITLSFTGASSVSVVNSFVSESGTVTIQADTAVAALSVTGRASLTEILEVYASDSLDGDLSFNGSTGDKVIVVGQTDADAFSLAGVVVPTIELRGDTLGGYNLTYSTSQATGSMTVSLVGGVGADTTDVTWASASSDSINMSIFTQGGADSIITGSGADFISTGVGADTVQSGSGADTINAADGSNYTDAGAGDDSIVVLGGADTVFAGSGNDYLSIGNGANVVDLGTGRDSVYGGTGADSVFAGASDSVGDLYMLYGGADTVYAGSGADTIDVSAVAGDSADYVSSGGGNDSVLTGDGNDTVLDGAGYDSIWTGSGNDYVSFDSGADSVGTDYIYLGSGADTLIGSADSGGLYVTVDSTDTVGDVIQVGFGNDTIVAAGGADSILGGSGNDSILAQGLLTSADSMSDTVRGGFGADYIDLGLSGLGDTDYVIVGAGTLAGSQASDYEGLAADSSQESWAFSVDTVYNFDLWYGASDSLTYDILSFSWMDASVADSVAGDVGAVLKSGVISGFAENAVASQTDLQGALNTVETYASLTTGEVVAFKWQSNWYVAVAVADNQLGAVVRLAGIDDIDSIVGAAGGYYLKDLPGI